MARRPTLTLNRSDAARKSLSSCELNERIQKKAYDLFQRRGSSHGSDMKDWLEAERMVMSELKRS